LTVMPSLKGHPRAVCYWCADCILCLIPDNTIKARLRGEVTQT